VGSAKICVERPIALAISLRLSERVGRDAGLVQLARHRR